MRCTRRDASGGATSMIDPERLQEAKQALGRRLRDMRTARGLRQKDVAERVVSTRSTVANVETGRQLVDRVFWQQCDALLLAGGQLLGGYDAYRRLERQHHAERDEAARRARWGAAAAGLTGPEQPGSDLPAVRQRFVLEPRTGQDASLASVSLLDQAAGGAWEGLPLTAPGGRFFPGVAVDVEVYPAVDDGRILATVSPADAGWRWRRSPQRRLVAGRVGTPTGDRLFALDAGQASRRLVGVGDDARLIIPRVYRLDAITAALLWAVANLDQSLLLDDARLEASRAAAVQYSRLTRSAVSGDIAQGLDAVSRMWLGSAFCADHISRHSANLTEAPPTGPANSTARRPAPGCCSSTSSTTSRRPPDGSSTALRARRDCSVSRRPP
ncbi:helix-turn-helix transcriptional regulator [Phytohabitans suffuscus]